MKKQCLKVAERDSSMAIIRWRDNVEGFSPLTIPRVLGPDCREDFHEAFSKQGAPFHEYVFQNTVCADQPDGVVTTIFKFKGRHDDPLNKDKGLVWCGRFLLALLMDRPNSELLHVRIKKEF